MRLFIGIKLDNITIKKINNYFNYFYQNGIFGNYTRSENLHLTLIFLGEINNCNNEKLKEIIEVINSVNLKINSIKITKITKLKDMIIGTVENNKELQSIYDELYKKLKEKNYRLENRTYFPHITLVRKATKFIEKEILLESKVDKITLFSSSVINNTLVYKPLNEGESDE